MRRIFTILIICALCIFKGVSLYSHCQIPCGIYDDEMRVSQLKENTATIEKSISEILKLEKMKNIENNQMVRWVFNKDKHADSTIDIVTNYFLAQRIKIEDGASKKDIYLYQLELLHKIIVCSMKAKQSLNIENIKELKNNIPLSESFPFRFPANEKLWQGGEVI